MRRKRSVNICHLNPKEFPIFDNDFKETRDPMKTLWGSSDSIPGDHEHLFWRNFVQIIIIKVHFFYLDLKKDEYPHNTLTRNNTFSWQSHSWHRGTLLSVLRLSLIIILTCYTSYTGFNRIQCITSFVRFQTLFWVGIRIHTHLDIHKYPSSRDWVVFVKERVLNLYMCYEFYQRKSSSLVLSVSQ